MSGSVDWGRYGLVGDKGGNESSGPRPVDRGQEEYGSQAQGDNELFAEEQGDKPWWKSQFFISEPVLFGTWDGVFTSCMINILGVIVFLRSGWIVGQAGIGNAILIIMVAVVIISTSVFAAIGICLRCQVQSGGVYFLLSHILGSKIGGSLGLIYCFGQAVGCALYATGFGESFSGLFFDDPNPWFERGTALVIVVLLGAINVAGVKWVIKLQFLLLVVLLLAALDFIVGSAFPPNYETGFEGWGSGNFRNNSGPDYTEGNNWFSVFGVFFPTMTGIMAGINMSGDLRKPARDIPLGTVAALGFCTCVYLVFMIILGATCTREALLTDFMIVEKVSLVGFLLIMGICISSLSSSLATLYGTPRVLQSIANEGVIPIARPLGKGRGPNKVPVMALAVISVITMTFILIGQINTLAPIVTMPFLLTYAGIDYAYFALAMTADMRREREERYRSQGLASPTFDAQKVAKKKKSQNYGSVEGETKIPPGGDLDQLFPERSKVKSGYDKPQEIISPEEDLANRRDSSSDFAFLLANWDENRNLSGPSGAYGVFCNRWSSLVGCVTKLVLMFLVHWIYALCVIVIVFILALYISQANPGVSPGVAAHFSLIGWLKNLFLRLIGKRSKDYEQVVVNPQNPDLSTTPAQLTEENEDFSERSRYHHMSTHTVVGGNVPQIDGD